MKISTNSSSGDNGSEGEDRIWLRGPHILFSQAELKTRGRNGPAETCAGRALR